MTSIGLILTYTVLVRHALKCREIVFEVVARTDGPYVVQVLGSVDLTLQGDNVTIWKAILID